MNRRALFFAGLALPLAARAADAASTVEVVYVGGKDCPYCALWREKYEAEWRASLEFRRVEWIEIEPAHLRDAYQSRYWPGELAGILEQVPRKNGTPRFLIVKNGKVVFNELGADKWRRTVLAMQNELG